MDCDLQAGPRIPSPLTESDRRCLRQEIRLYEKLAPFSAIQLHAVDIFLSTNMWGH